MNTRTIRNIIIIILAIAILVTGTACKDVKVVNPCQDNACHLMDPAGDVQQAVTDWVRDTCQKDAAGNCKTMGN